ncbi:hypothetical protein B0H15DRAFT_1017872 [Mycena belliarum]|uniref:Rap1 Myb domain-containing protein n=1 Tax=Mycena belliarum TaxID=1033014 RepID=A0AAD6UG96_9AGAR|nr:hypothetical protein B0H15DRAFT_1017872 [Mycena belliae]
MAPPRGKEGGLSSKRARNDFTVSEDEEFVNFLAGRPPDARASITTYRRIVAEPWGSKHTENSWLQRYNRRRSHYDHLIDALVLNKPSQASDPREEEDQEYEGPPKKRQKLATLLTDDPDESETFPDLHITYGRFMRKPKPLSDTDQLISLNLAINLLSRTHGLDPEIVYETWERIGDLRLTDEHLCRTANGPESVKTDEADIDREILDLLEVDPQRASIEPDSGAESSSSRKRSDSRDHPSHDAPSPASPPPRRLRLYGRASACEVVPSSIPEEIGLPGAHSCRAAVVPSRANREEGTVVPETPQPSSQSTATQGHVSPSRGDDWATSCEVSGAESPQPKKMLLAPAEQDSDTYSEASGSEESDADALPRRQATRFGAVDRKIQVQAGSKNSDSGGSESEPPRPQHTESLQRACSEYSDDAVKLEEPSRPPARTLHAEDSYIPTQTSLFG